MDTAKLMFRDGLMKGERILVTAGDTVILRGTEYTISKDNRGYIHLTPVQVPAAV